MESPTAGINETSEGEIIVQGPKFNLKLSGQEIINNGTTVWTYLKESNEVNITNYEPGRRMSPLQESTAFTRKATNMPFWKKNRKVAKSMR